MSIFIQYVQMRTSESMNAIVHRKMNHLEKKVQLDHAVRCFL